MGPRESSYQPEICSTGTRTRAMFVVTECARQYASRVECASQRSHIGSWPQPRRSGNRLIGRYMSAGPTSRSAMLSSIRERMRHVHATLIGETTMSSYGTMRHGSPVAADGAMAARCGGALTAAYH